MTKNMIEIAVIGDPFVGKSSLIRSYFNEEFSEVHSPELCDKTAFDLQITEKSHKVKIHDTKKSTRLDYSTIDLIILCYSIENRISYRNVRNKWIEELKMTVPNWPIPFVLVATKIDLRQEFPSAFFLTTEDGENLSREMNAVKYFETSSKENVNIQQLIEHSVKILFPKEEKVEEKLKTFTEEAQISSKTGNELKSKREEQIGNQKKSSCICC